MENSRKVVVLLIILVLILVCALIYTVSRLNKACGVPFVIPEGIENKTTTKTVETKVALNNDDIATLQKKIGDVFKEEVLESDNVEEVRINRMTFYDGKELSELINEEYDPEKFFVDISYDVKVKDVEEGLVGNGEEGEDNWIVEKSACTILKRAGDTFEIQSSGTGW